MSSRVLAAFLVAIIAGCIGGTAEDPVVARSTATMFDPSGHHFGQVAVTKQMLTFRQGVFSSSDTDVVLPLDDVIRAAPFQWNNEPGADVELALDLRNGTSIRFTVAVTQRPAILATIQERIAARNEPTSTKAP